MPVDSAGDFSFKNAFGSPMQIAWATGVGSPTDASWAQHGGDGRGRGILTVTIDSCMTDAPDTAAPTPAPGPVVPTFTENCGPFPVVQGGAMAASYWLGTSAGQPAVMIEAKFPKQVNGAPSWGAIGLRTSGFTGMKNLDSTTFDSTDSTKVYNNILLRSQVMPSLDLRAGFVLQSHTMDATTTTVRFFRTLVLPPRYTVRMNRDIQIAWAYGEGVIASGAYKPHTAATRGFEEVLLKECVLTEAPPTDVPETDAPVKTPAPVATPAPGPVTTPAPGPVVPTFTENCGPFPVVQGGAMTASYWLGTSAGQPAVMIEAKFPKQVNGAPSWGAIGLRTSGFTGMKNLDSTTFDSTDSTKVYNNILLRSQVMPSLDLRAGFVLQSHTMDATTTTVRFFRTLVLPPRYTVRMNRDIQIAWAYGEGVIASGAYKPHTAATRGFEEVLLKECVLTEAPETDAPVNTPAPVTTPAPGPVVPTFTENCGPFPVVQGGAMAASYWLGTSAGQPAVMIEAKFPKQVNGAPSWGAIGLRTSGFTGMKNLDSTTFDSTDSTKVYNNILLRSQVMPSLDLRAGFVLQSHTMDATTTTVRFFRTLVLPPRYTVRMNRDIQIAWAYGEGVIASGAYKPHTAATRGFEEVLLKECVLTEAPPTDVPETDVPETNVPETDVPETSVPDTLVPETQAPDTLVPDTDAPDTDVPETLVPDTLVPDTLVPDTLVPDTLVPDTLVPDTSVPATTVPDTLVPDTAAPPTDEPESAAPPTNVPPLTTAPTAQPTLAPGDTAAPTAEPTLVPGATAAPTAQPPTPWPGTFPISPAPPTDTVAPPATLAPGTTLAPGATLAPGTYVPQPPATLAPGETAAPVGATGAPRGETPAPTGLYPWQVNTGAPVRAAAPDESEGGSNTAVIVVIVVLALLICGVIWGAVAWRWHQKRKIAAQHRALQECIRCDEMGMQRRDDEVMMSGSYIPVTVSEGGTSYSTTSC